MLGHVAFQRVWCAVDSMRWFPYDCDAASVHAVPVFHWVRNKRGHSGARPVAEEYTPAEGSLPVQEKSTSLADDQQTLEVYKTWKDKSGSNFGGNESKVIP